MLDLKHHHFRGIYNQKGPSVWREHVLWQSPEREKVNKPMFGWVERSALDDQHSKHPRYRVPRKLNDAFEVRSHPNRMLIRHILSKQCWIRTIKTLTKFLTYVSQSERYDSMSWSARHWILSIHGVFTICAMRALRPWSSQHSSCTVRRPWFRNLLMQNNAWTVVVVTLIAMGARENAARAK